MVQQVLQSRLSGDSVVAGMFLVPVGIGFPLALRLGCMIGLQSHDGLCARSYDCVNREKRVIQSYD
jgi:hypothetical protein